MSASTWRLHLPGVQTVLGQRRSWISIPPPGYLDGPGEPACAVTLNYVMEIVQGSRFRCLRGNRALSTWTNGIQTKSRIQLPGQAAPSLGATHENSDWNFKKIRKIKVDPVISCVLHWEFWGQMPQLIHLAWCPAYTGCSGNLYQMKNNYSQLCLCQGARESGRFESSFKREYWDAEVLSLWSWFGVGVVTHLKAFLKAYLARACLCAGVWNSMNVLSAGP